MKRCERDSMKYHPVYINNQYEQLYTINITFFVKNFGLWPLLPLIIQLSWSHISLAVSTNNKVSKTFKKVEIFIFECGLSITIFFKLAYCSNFGVQYVLSSQTFKKKLPLYVILSTEQNIVPSKFLKLLDLKYIST